MCLVENVCIHGDLRLLRPLKSELLRDKKYSYGAIVIFIATQIYLVFIAIILAELLN